MRISQNKYESLLNKIPQIESPEDVNDQIDSIEEFNEIFIKFIEESNLGERFSHQVKATIHGIGDEVLMIRKQFLDEENIGPKKIVDYLQLIKDFLSALEYYVPNHTLKREIMVHEDVLKLAKKYLKDSRIKVQVIANVDSNSKLVVNTGTLLFLVKNIIKNASYHGEASQAQWQISEDENKVLWSFLDNGKGVKEIDIPHVFKEGYSGGNSTGIGLGDMTEKLQQFGASISSESNGGLPNKEDSKGAKIAITLKKT